ncbi:sesquipedalian-1 [Galendromus occidentalis]|uniref:Sesquipedalian-1 n=1 Tax=Galendromus occidentalis TaxID=34638 RepID=A0AAJ6QNB7_9ACAR|nr:sesquipedalian-1 [Galendromus occidentalis]
MKIYLKQLVSIATSKTPADRQGWLLKRGEVNKNFQKRWFVLRGNMLFYFEKPDREPVGLIVLEGCSIELAECSETERYAFLVIFHGPGARIYTMAANSQDDMEGWMKALSCANYDFLRNTVAELQRQIDEIRSTTQSSAPTGKISSLSLSPAVTPPPQAPPRKKSSPPRQPPSASLDFNPFNYVSTTAAQQATRMPTTFDELHTRYALKIQEVFNEPKLIAQCPGQLIDL